MRINAIFPILFFFVSELDAARKKRVKFGKTLKKRRSRKINRKADYGIYYTHNLPNQNKPLLIPKIFHSVWFDFGNGYSIPEKYVENRQKLMHLHPEWTIMEWNEEKVIDLIKRNTLSFLNTFLSYDKPIKKHDSSRAVILHAYGGVYVDHDFYPIRNIEFILKSYTFVAGNERKAWFEPSNGIMACTKNHGLMYKYIQFMSRPGEAEKSVLLATGPHMLRKVIYSYVRKHTAKQMKVYDISFFYDYSNARPTSNNITDDELRAKYPNCIFMHGYDFVWKNQ